MSDVFLDFYRSVRISPSLILDLRDAASRRMEDDAKLLSGSHAAIDSSRELLRQMDQISRA